jgi:hypothetical protein
MKIIHTLIKMNKQILMAFIVLMTIPAASVSADFGYFKLVMVVYDPSSDEMLRDLGVIAPTHNWDTQGPMDLTRENTTILPAGSFGPEFFSGASGWEALNATFYAYFQTDPGLIMFATTSKGEPEITTGSFTSFSTCANDIKLQYSDAGDVAIGDVNADRSYHRRMNNLHAPGGSFAGFHTNPDHIGEANLAPLGTDQPVDMYLYYFTLLPDDSGDVGVRLYKRPGQTTDYYAVMRLNPDGSLILNPEVVQEPPVADAGGDLSVNENEQVVLIGNATDPNGSDDIVSYAWSQTGGSPQVTITNADAATANFMAPEVGTPTPLELEFTLTVTDRGDAAHSDTVTVTVNDTGTSQQPPEIQNASADPLQVPAQAAVTLSATATDEDGDALTYTWQQTAPADPLGTLTDDDTADGAAVYTAPAVDEDVDITLTLTVDDGNGGQATRSLTITVQADADLPPLADAAASPQSVDLGQAATVELNGSASSDPEDGTALTYLWEQAAGGAFSATIDNADQAVASVSIPAHAPEGTLRFTLTVTDTADNSDTAECSVQLLETNGRQPPVAVAGTDQTLYEGQPVSLDGSGSTDPDDDITGYVWTQQTGPQTVELTSSTDGTATFTAPRITAVSADFTFMLTVTDDAGFESTDTVTITIVKNNAPNAPSCALINLPGYNYAQSETAAPVLRINNATDPDSLDTLTYDFQIFSADAMDPADLVGSATGVEEGAGGTTTQWAAPALNENTIYYWRSRADDGKEPGPWMTTAAILINANDEPPSMPAVSSPVDGTAVDTQTPVLEITNAADPDLTIPTYAFRLYANENDPVDQPLVEQADVPENPSGATQWTVTAALEEGSTYWWRARAEDNTGLSSDWTTPVSFTVDSENAAPSDVVFLSPQDRSEVTDTEVTITIENSTDADGDAIAYYFELDTVNSFDSTDIITSGEVAEMQGRTTWIIPGTLVENTVYYLRAKAGEVDGDAESAWTVLSFRLNQINDPPGTPHLLYPVDDIQITTLAPTLEITPAQPGDPDDDGVAYEFAVYASSNLEDPVADVTDHPSAQWTVTSGALFSGKKYYWHVRAVDEHGLAGEWSTWSTFITNGNFYQPSTPTVLSPYNGGIVDTRMPILSVLVPAEGDGNGLWVEFELYRNSELTDYVDYALIAKGDMSTTWQLDRDLDDQVRYYWRCRATDGEKYSAWSPVCEFLVDAGGMTTAPRIHLWAVENYDPVMPWDTVVRVDSADSPIFRAEAVFPAGAMGNQASIYIGEAVDGVPAMDPTRIPIGRVFEFGPTAAGFDLPVTIKLPYTQADLDAAGAASEDGLAVMTYNEEIFAWEEIPIEAIDHDLNLVISKVEHFSMFTLATAGDRQNPADVDDATGIGGGGGGGGASCFIGTLGGFSFPAAGFSEIFRSNLFFKNGPDGNMRALVNWFHQRFGYRNDNFPGSSNYNHRLTLR